MPTSLETVLHHLYRASELLKEVQAEQHGMPETHVLENLAIFQATTEGTHDRLEELIAEMREGKA